jgi:type 1 glutamine amidotransferase
VRALAFSRTADFRHESIPAGLAALRELGPSAGLVVESTEDSSAFTASTLRRYAVVVFLNTSGEVLNDAQRAALEAYVRDGGGFVGVHCAAATEPRWPFYRWLVGAAFADHPDIQPARIRVADRSHPATAHLAEVWDRTDEWYNFDTAPRAGVRVLLRVDESSYAGGTMGADHPVAWCHDQAGGRAIYTALGHTVDSYAEAPLRAHLLGALAWAGGRQLAV